MDFKLIRSKRRTISMEITAELEILVRAPKNMPMRSIERFVADHEAWAEKHIESRRERQAKYPEQDEYEEKKLREAARALLPGKLKYYGGIMGVTPTGLKITGAAKRFGSCSGKNSLCFSYRLMLYPEAAIDYVVVHELAHIRFKNHGREFYAFIESVLPDYRERIKLLKG